MIFDGKGVLFHTVYWVCVLINICIYFLYLTRSYLSEKGLVITPRKFLLGGVYILFCITPLLNLVVPAFFIAILIFSYKLELLVQRKDKTYKGINA